MQESIKEVINIHKYKFFFLFYAGLWACELTTLVRPVFFLRACELSPNCHP